jgi:hypothetical protein
MLLQCLSIVQLLSNFYLQNVEINLLMAPPLLEVAVIDGT